MPQYGEALTKRFPGQHDGYTIFSITFQDGYVFHAMTGESIWTAAQRERNKQPALPGHKPVPPVARHAQLMEINNIAVVSNHPDEPTARKELDRIHADLPEGVDPHPDNPLLHCHAACWIPSTIAIDNAVGVWHGHHTRDGNA